MIRWFVLVGVLGIIVGFVYSMLFSPNRNSAYLSVPVNKEKYIVKIGKYLITEDQLNREFQFSSDAVKSYEVTKEGLFHLKKNILRSLILRKIQIQEIRSKGFSLGEYEKDVFKDMKEQYRDDEVYSKIMKKIKDKDYFENIMYEKKLIEKYMKEVIYGGMEIKQLEVKRYYSANEDEFKRPERVRASQIVLKTEKEANKLYSELKNRSSTKYFAYKAKELSTTPEASKGGDLGYFSRDELPKMFQVVFSMRNRKIRGVIKSPYGFHIIQRTGYQPEKQLSLNEVATEIQQKLIANEQKKRYQEWIDLLLRKTSVAYHKDYIHFK